MQLVEQTDGIIYVKVSVMFRWSMADAVLRRLEKKVDAISDFLEDVYITKEEEERLKRADKIVREGRLKELTKVV